MEKNKSNNLIACIICGVLTVFGIAASAMSLAEGGTTLRMFRRIVRLFLFILSGYYAFWGYRKPHGNLLKYLILIFAGSHIIAVFSKAQDGEAWAAVYHATIACLSFYIAGRLHKVKENMILLSVAAAVIVIYKVVKCVTGEVSPGDSASVIIWLDIFAAYFLRFREHIKAGLADAPAE